MKSNLALLVSATVIPFALAQDITECFGEVKHPKSKNPECGGTGTLAKPKVRLDLGGLKFDDCSGRCGALGFRCKSLSYSKTDGSCTLYKQTLDDQGFSPSSQAPADVHYFNKRCLNITCGPYCGFAPVRVPKPAAADEIITDGSFESENAPAWVGGTNSSISDNCNGGDFPYDGIRFGKLVNTRDSRPYLFQFSGYKTKVQYIFTYRYRVSNYFGGAPQNFCNLTPFFSGEVFDSELFSKFFSATKYKTVEFSLTPTKRANPQVIQFLLTCTTGVEAVVDIDKVSMVPA